jgi:hypothetical protein
MFKPALLSLSALLVLALASVSSASYVKSFDSPIVARWVEYKFGVPYRINYAMNNYWNGTNYQGSIIVEAPSTSTSATSIYSVTDLAKTVADLDHVYYNYESIHYLSNNTRNEESGLTYRIMTKDVFTYQTYR